MPPALPPAEIVEQSLVDWVQERCDAVRVEVLWLGHRGEVPANATLVWDGRPCVPQPQLRLSAVAQGRRVGSWAVAPRLRLVVRGPVTPGPVARGQRFTSVQGDIVLRPGVISAQPGTWTARVDLSAGAPVTAAVARPSPDVERGSAVTIEVQRGAVRVSTTGTLMQDGWLGRPVRVLNDTTRVAQAGRLIDAQTVRLD